MIHSRPRIAISAPLLAPAGSYRSAGIHTYIQHSLQHLPEADPSLQLTLFTAHPPAELPPSIEVHLFDFEGDLYGEELRVEFCQRLRDIHAFTSVQRLIDAIREDCDVARVVLSRGGGACRDPAAPLK